MGKAGTFKGGFPVMSQMYEENGKTVRENKMEISHKIPVGALIEIKYDEWLGDGGSMKVHARLWVFGHHRDCDGTPLYILSHKKPTGPPLELHSLHPEKVFEHAFYRTINGYGEDKLTVVTVTDDMLTGADVLEWPEDDD